MSVEPLAPSADKVPTPSVTPPPSAAYSAAVSGREARPVPGRETNRGLPPGKKTMVDVVAVKKLLAPEDELRQMTLEQFRRLGRTPEARANKILDIIEVLGEESFTRKSAGMANWRQSPLFNLYRSIGQQALAKGRPIAEIIIGQEGGTLTMEEYRALINMQSHL